MATDLFLLDRIRSVLTERQLQWVEKRMFGGDCFMLDNKMCFGTFRGGLMARVAPEEFDALLTRPGAAQMTLGDKSMAGYVFIEPEGYDMDVDLEFWIDRCLAFNPRAKASKKK